MGYRETYMYWKDAVREKHLLDELDAIRNDDGQIKERFIGDLPSGRPDCAVSWGRARPA